MKQTKYNEPLIPTTVRMPASLKRRLERLAYIQDIAVNTIVLRLLDRALTEVEIEEKMQ